MQTFANYFKKVGDGEEKVYGAVGEDYVMVPPSMCCTNGGAATLHDLTDDVYGMLPTYTSAESRAAFLIERAILTPLNEDVDKINNLVLEKLELSVANGSNPVVTKVYKSADAFEESESLGYFPTEFLNTLKLSGLPPHELHLRVGCPIILLRNLTGRLANGTRLITKGLTDRVIEAVVATGPDKGGTVLIPRITLEPSEKNLLPFTLKRRQFSVRVAYAMTINKSQGQTLKSVGVYLPRPVFTHGQLYVALSRVGSPAGIKVLAVGGWRQAADGVPAGCFTRNVVYREVL